LAKGDWRRRVKKSGLKRDGPVFFSSAPVKVAGDERMLMAIVASMSRRSPGQGGSEEGGLRPWPSVVKKWSPASRWLKTQKLPNEPNLKTAPPAIPARHEGKSD